MIRRPPRSTRTDTRFPSPTLFRSWLIVSAEIGPDGEVIFNRELADQRTLEPYSGLYWQVSARGHEDFPSRSLWDRRLTFSPDHHDVEIHAYDSAQFPRDRKSTRLNSSH